MNFGFARKQGRQKRRGFCSDVMAPKSDIVDELQRAANTIFDVDPLDRQRVLRCGIDEATSLGRLLHLEGIPDREKPNFFDDMPALIEMSAKPDAVEVLVAAGMSLLAGEIERLRGILEGIANEEAAQSPTLADALSDAGFEASIRDRMVMGQGRNREPLQRRIPPSD